MILVRQSAQKNASLEIYLLRKTLMSRNARNGENGEKSPASGDLNWMPEWPLEASDLGENGEIGDFGENRQKAGGNRDKRLGPLSLETGNFGENGNCGEIGDLANITGELVISRMCQNIQLGRQKWPLQSR